MAADTVNPLRRVFEHTENVKRDARRGRTAARGPSFRAGQPPGRCDRPFAWWHCADDTRKPGERRLLAAGEGAPK